MAVPTVLDYINAWRHMVEASVSDEGWKDETDEILEEQWVRPCTGLIADEVSGHQPGVASVFEVTIDG